MSFGKRVVTLSLAIVPEQHSGEPPNDEAHERLIDACFHRWLDGRSEWPELVALIKARSPDQIHKMEAAKGLR